jgi:zinc protease
MKNRLDPEKNISSCRNNNQHIFSCARRYGFFLFLFILCLLPAHRSIANDKFLDIQTITTEQGLNAWLVEDHSVPVISLRFAFTGAGSRGETKNTQGLSQLASNTMDEGAGELDSTAFQQALRENAIELSFFSNRDVFGGTLYTRAVTLERAAQLLRMALINPRFDEEPVRRMKEANIARIRSSLSNPQWIAARLANDRGFGDHPYALNSGGTISSLQKLSLQDLHQFASTKLARENLKIALSGAITSEQAKELISKIFSELPAEARIPSVQDMQIQNLGSTGLYKTSIPQTIIRSWQPALDRDDEDYYPYLVMNQILGAGGFGSRLMEEIREKRGLTYGIYTSLNTMKHADFLSLGLSTANKNVPEVLTLSKQEMKKLQTEPVGSAELEDAKSYLIGSMALSLSSSSSIASLLLTMQLDELPVNYLDSRDDKIANVAASDVQRVARKWLQPDQMMTILVGEPENPPENTEILKELPNVE